jgi:hypothetical protein
MTLVKSAPTKSYAQKPIFVRTEANLQLLNSFFGKTFLCFLFLVKSAPTKSYAQKPIFVRTEANFQLLN